ncbi:class I SAM-dependent methyltransferase [Elizabethkingia meningoseptica]|uniref:class I SAM-dependent methyltransferase n=1 Tax=Elizabethkingia meningoseptica TaxID=238 RepID=UPI00201267B2|nr:class I SAM-dependent methyltransferase [Elizabethkingia meningoseptica]MCL1675955.1 class I SAM-dependent methyltransferase [Elizabethkingia meningoseptica]MCL1686399.1 class I SAM-dependent methyltransferase [Elizabethkingia meningoseptica]
MKIKDLFLTQEEFEIKEVSKGIFKTFPVPENLSKYYESKEYISHHQEDNSFKTKIYKFFQQHNLKYKKSILDTEVKTGNKILDYGCGAGEFINFLKESYQVKGIEPNESARNAAKQKVGNGNIKNNISEIEDLSLDAITLWHVFEHIDNQEEFLEQVYRKIKPGGKLIIAVPNYKSYDAQYYKEYWAAYDVPRHIYHFSKKGMMSIFENEKWTLKKVSPLLLDAYYISIMSEKYMKNSLFWIKGAFRGAISNKKASKTGDFSSLIYIIEKR